MLKKTFAALALTAALGAAPLTSSAAIVLSINPSTQNVAVGGDVFFDVTISGLDSGGIDEIVSVFDINILFNGTLLGLPATVTWNSALQMGFPDDADWFVSYDPAGDLGVDAFSFLTDDDDLKALQSDSFVLFSVHLTALAEGVTDLSFGPDPDFERLVVGRNAMPLDMTYIGACVSVGSNFNCNRVPEPSSYALVLAAFAASGWAMRRRRRS